MPLTDTTIRAAKPAAKPYRLYDAQGLYCEVAPSGARLWRLKYRFGGKEKRLALGTYPATGLSEARKRALDARGLLEQGQDPSETRKTHQAARIAAAENSFEAIAREWFGKHEPTWAKSHSSKILMRLEGDVFPWIGARPIAGLAAPDILTVVRRVEARGTLDTAHRVAQYCSQVFRYAVATGRADADPVPALRGALPPARGGHFAAITEPAKLGELLRSFDGFSGTHEVAAALRLLPILFVRPGELRSARWADLDLDRAEWRYVASKTNTDHLVPLPVQAVKILADLKPLTGDGEYVFPGRGKGRMMSDAAINAALRRLGWSTRGEITAHGFRATARTLLAEELGQDPQVIEHQLAHKVPDSLGKAYNRTKFIKQRREMMQTWADYLDKIKAGGDVLPFKGSRRG